MASFGKRLKELRLQRNISTKAIADVLNVSESSIRKYEIDTRTPTPEAIKKIAELLEVSTDSLLGRTIPKGTIVDQNYPNVEIAQLMKDNKFKLLKTAKDLTYEELKLGIDLARAVKASHIQIREKA